ncbi:MAG: mismatch repair protein [Acidobacteriaceae bacterium]
MESPEALYHRVLLENQARLALQQKLDTRLGYAKMVVFLTGAIAAIPLLHSPGLQGLLLIPVVIFVPLAVWHDRVLRAIRERKRVIEFYERGIARLQDRWAGTGDTGDRFLDPAHPYARDLDIFGKGSLFEFLCTVRTRAGEQTLARWLLHAALPEEIRSRQAAITEMKDRLRFRESLFVAGESVRLGVRPDALASWAERERMFPRWLAPALASLATLWVGSIAYALFCQLQWLVAGGAMPADSLRSALLMSIVNLGVSLALRRRVSESARAVEEAAEDLSVLAEVLQVLEQETFASARLRSLRASLDSGDIAPSAAVKRLKRIVNWLEGRRNLLVQMFSPFIFYSAELTMAAERWQQKFGSAIRGWLSTVGEFEALSALACYAWEHPADVLPEFVEQRACFEATGLAHPLLPASTAVGNDLTLGSKMQLIVISGPNMAGKSTFLRGVGINAVLAQCGAPVRATRLRLSPLAVGASICVLDSLQGGVSRFYAEIKRLKLLSDLAEEPAALLFLLDELLSGTNSRDRFDGTRFVVRALVRRGAIGMVTTHDLALTEIPQTMGELAQNYHFEDSIEQGELKFDYRLHAGIVRTSNALRLMQAVGLKLEE